MRARHYVLSLALLPLVILPPSASVAQSPDLPKRTGLQASLEHAQSVDLGHGFGMDMKSFGIRLESKAHEAFGPYAAAGYVREGIACPDAFGSCPTDGWQASAGVAIRPSGLAPSDVLGFYLAVGVGLMRWNGDTQDRYGWRREAHIGVDWTPTPAGLGLRFGTGLADGEWIVMAGILLYK